MPQLTSAQRADIIRAIAEGAHEITMAQAKEPVPEGYRNFEIALRILGEARVRFEADNWPQDAIEAERDLQAAHVALQDVNAGIAASSVTEARERLDLIVQQLDPDEGEWVE